MTTLELKAPTGKFRVVCVDTFDGTDWVEGDFSSPDDALECAARNSGTMLKAYVYTDDGALFHSRGTF